MWDRNLDIETTLKRRALHSEALARIMVAYFQTTRERGSFRSGGRGRVGGRGGGRGGEATDEKGFNCGESDNWRKECRKKKSICTWSGGTEHIEHTFYVKINRAVRGGKACGSASRGRGSGGTGRGQGGVRGKFGEGGEEQGNAEILMA